MKPAAVKMKEKINSVNFKKPKIDIVCNVTSKPENNAENIKKLLNRANFFYCKMERKYNSICLKKMYLNFIEIGPGKVLSGMVKRTVKDILIALV